jgi:hypothetical protein
LAVMRMARVGALLVAVSILGAATAAGETPMNDQHILGLDQGMTFSTGLTVTLKSIIVEEIAASPSNPAAYPAGSGVDVTLELRDDTGTQTVLLTRLSAGYESKPTAAWHGWTITLVDTRDEYREPKAVVRVTGGPPSKVDGASELLDSSVVFTFQVSAIRGEPVDADAGLSFLDADVQLVEMLKGGAAQKPRQVFAARLPLYLGRLTALPIEATGALWINLEPGVGSRWIVFFKDPAPRPDLAALLGSPKGKLAGLFEYGAAIDDVRFAIRAAGAGGAAAAVGMLPGPRDAGRVAAQAFWVRWGTELLAHRDLFSALLSRMEDRAANPDFVMALWQDLSDQLMLRQGLADYPRERDLEFLRLSFRLLLAMPADSPYRDNFAQTFLPNWLGIDSGLQKVSFAELFGDGVDGRDLVAFLKKNRIPGTDTLLRWSAPK